MAAKACADFHFPTLKAIAQIKDKDFSSMVEAARLRAAAVANVIHMKVVPKAIQHEAPAQHDASELKPDVSRSPGANGSGFKRRF
jgi:hypothetical protein